MPREPKQARAGLVPASDWTTHVVIALAELNALIDQADAALDGDSNDAEHDALFDLREALSDFSIDPDRRQGD